MSAETCVPAATVEVAPEKALHAARWLRLLGGVAVWGCLDLATPGRRFYTPATLTDGTPSPQPHWSATDKPECIITDASAIDVVERHEMKRIRIAVRKGAYGMRLKLTAHSSRKLEAALAKAGEGASYTFEGNSAIIHAVAHRTSLDKWLRENGHGDG